MSGSSIYTSVPEPWRAAVARSIQAAFPQQALEELAPLQHGGMSGALLFKLTVGGQHYLLRLIRERNELSDPRRQFAALRAAAQREVAPPLHHADPEAGICIMDYVEAQPLWPALRAGAGLLQQLGALLARMHSGPGFPTFLDGLQYIDGGLQTLRSAQAPLPELFQDYLAQFERVRETLRPHMVSAPCHNDMNPGNVLYDGERLWLVDWDVACMGDPLLDVASLIHWFALEPAQEQVLLRAYFDAEPDAYQGAKLELMKHVSWCFYALVFLLLALQGGQTAPPPEAEQEPLQGMRGALRAIGAGELSLHQPAGRYRMSLLIAGEGLAATRRPEFEQALRLLEAHAPATA